MRTSVVTGAAGFLGSHLVKALLQQGHRVIGLDNLSTGRLDHLQGPLSHPNFLFLYRDVSLPVHDLREELRAIDDIYHLASPASPILYQADPFATIDVNTLGTKHMLDLARLHGAKLLYASTSEAYGDPEVHPQPESYRGCVNTWGPRACYDESKRLGEVYSYEYHARYGVRVKVARIFNTYSAGLRNDDGRVISNFVTQALDGRDLTVYGDGSQTRSFCYVDDTIAGLMRMMDTDAANGEIINIGNPSEHTILEVAELVIRLSRSPSGLVFAPLPQDDPRKRRPDISKAMSLLHWMPKISLEEGLKRTIEQYRRNAKRKRGECT